MATPIPAKIQGSLVMYHAMQDGASASKPSQFSRVTPILAAFMMPSTATLDPTAPQFSSTTVFTHLVKYVYWQQDCHLLNPDVSSSIFMRSLPYLSTHSLDSLATLDVHPETAFTMLSKRPPWDELIAPQTMRATKMRFVLNAIFWVYNPSTQQMSNIPISTNGQSNQNHKRQTMMLTVVLPPARLKLWLKSAANCAVRYEIPCGLDERG